MSIIICVFLTKMPTKRCSCGDCNSDSCYKWKKHMLGVNFVPFTRATKLKTKEDEDYGMECTPVALNYTQVRMIRHFHI